MINPSHTQVLNNGNKIPMVGLGTFLTNNKDEMVNLLRSAFDCGYRHIDTAVLYQNEAMIGEALQAIFREGKYKREDIFIVSKIFPNGNINLVDAVRQSLKDLQVKYIDLYYLHFSCAVPNEKGEFTHKPVHVSWAELEEAHRLGLVKSIGVSNFNVMALCDLLSYAKVKPVSNQVEVSVFVQQKNLIRFCQKYNIHVTAYSPLAKYADVATNQVLQKIAKKHNAQISQVLLAFLLVQGVSVIPKTDKIARLKENYDSINLKLTQEDMKELETLHCNKRVIDPSVMDFWQKIPLFD